jgi:uncharacterized protein YbjT (DUF2867 family)
VLVREAAKAPPGVDVAVGDLTRPRTLARAFDGVRKAFVLAPFPNPDMEKMETNAFIAAEQAGVEHIVYLSNFGAGRYDGELWAAHGTNEWRLRALNSAWTILRPTRFMSSVPFAWTSVLAKGRLLEPPGGAKVVMIDPDDIGAVAAQILTTPGHESKIYELSGQALSGSEIAADLSHVLGRPVEFVEVSEDETRQDLVASGVPAEVVQVAMTYFATLSAGHWYQTKTVADLLGRQPRSYSDWLRDHLSEVLDAVGVK